MSKNILIAQSGGPSMVINQSLVGVVLAARGNPDVGKIYGALHGIQGILDEQFVDLRFAFAQFLFDGAGTVGPDPFEIGQLRGIHPFEFFQGVRFQDRFADVRTDPFDVQRSQQLVIGRGARSLDLPEKIAQRKGCHIILCIDEFQQVGEFPNSLNIQKRMRTVWQHQQNVTYCLYGSKMHMMTNLFQKKSYPFYKFGEMLYLKPIPLKDWTTYISSRFEREKKHISEELIRLLCESVEFQSSYVQQLAYCTLLLTKKTVTKEILNQAIEDLVNQNSGVFIEQVESLTTYQMNFLRAVLSGVSSGFGEKAVRENFDLGVPSNITRLKQSLIDKELVEITEKGIIIGDPVLIICSQKVL